MWRQKLGQYLSRAEHRGRCLCVLLIHSVLENSWNRCKQTKPCVFSSARLISFLECLLVAYTNIFITSCLAMIILSYMSKTMWGVQIALFSTLYTTCIVYVKVSLSYYRPFPLYFMIKSDLESYGWLETCFKWCLLIHNTYITSGFTSQTNMFWWLTKVTVL